MNGCILIVLLAVMKGSYAFYMVAAPGRLFNFRSDTNRGLYGISDRSKKTFSLSDSLWLEDLHNEDHRPFHVQPMVMDYAEGVVPKTPFSAKSGNYGRHYYGDNSGTFENFYI